jgi:hypothetical protein
VWLRLRRRPRASATSPTPRSRTAASCGDEGFISVVVVVDSVTGKISGGPEIHARGFAEDDAVFEGVRPLIEEALARRPATGSATPTSFSSSSGGWWAAGSATPTAAVR